MTYRISLPTGHARLAQQGFSLVELIVTISIIAILSIYGQAQLAKLSEEQIGVSAGSYLKQVAGAAEQYALSHFDDLGNGVDIPGVANDIAPTIAELVADNKLPGGFPSGVGAMPTRQSLRIDVVKTNCPGLGCAIVTNVCTTTGVTLGGTNVRYDLAQVMVDQQGGAGGQSGYVTPALIKGPSLNIANPNGAIAGTVCSSATLNTAMFQQFVRVRDPRDPDLQGDLSAVGNLSIGGTSTLTGNVAAAGNVSVAGSGGFGGADPVAVPAGMKGVNSQDIFAAGNIVATDQGAGFAGNNGNYVAMTTNSGGEAAVVTSGRMAGNRLIPTGTYTKGTACVEPGAFGLSATEASGSIVVCSSGRWVPLMTSAIAGGACSTEGQGASDPDGLTLYCTGNIWTPMTQFLPIAADSVGGCVAGQLGYSVAVAGVKKAMLCRDNPQAPGSPVWKRLEDVTTNLVFVKSIEVTDNQVVSMPTCGSSPVGTPIIQLIPKTESSADGGFTRFAQVNGTNWTVRLMNGSGGALTGNPQASAIGHVYCYFA